MAVKVKGFEIALKSGWNGRANQVLEVDQDAGKAKIEWITPDGALFLGEPAIEDLVVIDPEGNHVPAAAALVKLAPPKEAEGGQ